MILLELEKPKVQQKFTEDFFIEMERSLGTVLKRLPEYEEKKDDIRDALISKYREGKISAVTDFRQLSKIATALDNLDVERSETKRMLDRVFNPQSSTGIKEAYEASVAFEYDERKYFRYADDIEDFLSEVVQENRLADLDADLLARLEELHTTLSRVLGK